MNGRNTLVTIIQQKYINKIKVHLLIFNTFSAFNLRTKHGTYQSTCIFTFCSESCILVPDVSTWGPNRAAFIDDIIKSLLFLTLISMPVLTCQSTKGWIPLKLSISLRTPFRKGEPTALSLRKCPSCQQVDTNTNSNFTIPVYQSGYLYRLYRMDLSDLFL